MGASRGTIVVGAAANPVGPTTTFARMPFPDEPDDDSGFIPPLPQDDRLWRHPSEMAGPNTPSVHRRRRSRSGILALLVLGALVTASGLAAIGIVATEGSDRRGTAFAIGPAAEQFSEEALAALAPALVQIAVDRADDVAVVTGLIIRPDGHVVTASDPLEGARAITVTTADGRAFNATVVGVDPSDDLAVIDIEGSGLPTPTFGDSGALAQGDTLYVVGRPGSERRSWIAQATFQSSGLRLDAPDGTSMHGMIGSAIETPPPTDATVLTTRRGEVVGLVVTRPVTTPRASATGSAPSTLGLPRAVNAFAHSISWTRHVAEEIIASGTVHHAWMGVMSTDAPEGGAAILSVASPGPAEAAGLSAGDRVITVDGGRVATSSDLIVALRRFRAGDTVQVGLVRDGLQRSVPVRLSDRT